MLAIYGPWTDWQVIQQTEEVCGNILTSSTLVCAEDKC